MELRQTLLYELWFEGLRDQRAKDRIDARIRNLVLGNPGDVAPVGEGVSVVTGPLHRRGPKRP